MFFMDSNSKRKTELDLSSAQSYDSMSGSTFASPIINDEIVLDLLYNNEEDDTAVSDTEGSQSKGKFKKLIETLTWRKKKSKKPTFSAAISNDVANNILADTGRSHQGKAATSLQELFCNEYYGNSKSMSFPYNKEMIQSSDYRSENIEHIGEASGESTYEYMNNGDQENLYQTEKIDSMTLNEAATQKQSSFLKTENAETSYLAPKSSRKSLSRRFSFFSKSKSIRLPCELNIQNKLTFFDDELYLSLWRLPDMNYFPRILLDGDVNDDNIDPNKDICLFQKDWWNENQDTNKEKDKSTNKKNSMLEKIIYYPYTKEMVDERFTENHELTIENESFGLDGNLKLCLSQKYLDPSRIQIPSLSFKSFYLNETVEEWRKPFFQKRIFNTDANPSTEINNLLNVFNVSALVSIQSGNNSIQPMRLWNLWIKASHNDTIKKNKYTVFAQISTREHAEKLQCDYDALLTHRVYDNNEKLSIVQFDVKPIFHGKNITTKYGEYIYVIPIKHAKSVWTTIVDLLVTECLNQTIVQYEVVGISWERYAFKGRYGFHLTLHVDDRCSFDVHKIQLWLSEIRLLIPAGIKHCFGRCKTLAPGNQEISVFEVQ